VAPVDDNGFARRAGEIIARAAHSKDAVHRRHAVTGSHPCSV
jgi:hypothetical protein